MSAGAGKKQPFFAAPVPRELQRPLPWIPKAYGPVKYLKAGTKRMKCEDCLHVILDHNQGRTTGPPPPLANMAAYRRVQGNVAIHLCAGHAHLHQADERK